MRPLCFLIGSFLLAIGAHQARSQTENPPSPCDAPLAYCQSTATFAAQYIKTVKTGSIYNITTGSASGYSDYSTLSTALASGASIALTVTGAFTYTSDQCGVWVDWNNDADFSDDNETITVSGTPGLGPYTANLSPPAGTTPGSKRLRIRIANSGISACGTTTYGETEDYTLIVGGTSLAHDLGTIDLITPVTSPLLDSAQTIRARIYNFGDSAQTGFMVSFRIDNGLIVNEFFTDTLFPGTFADFTFIHQAYLSIPGQTYLVACWTTLATDQCPDNDGVVRSVTHGWGNFQKVVQGEYYTGADPGEGNGIPIVGTYNLVDVSVNIENLSLPVGNIVYTRFKSEDGIWSFPRGYQSKSFFSNTNGQLLLAEYFINEDPGRGNATSLPIVNGNINLEGLDLPMGSTVYLRVRDTYNRWSEPTGMKRGPVYYSQGAKLAQAEYFIDTDPGQGNGLAAPLSSSGVISLTNLVAAPGQKVYLRVRDSLNRWSYPRGWKRPVMPAVSGSTLAGGEYFINDDPGTGNGISLSFNGNTAQIANLSLQNGDVLYVRAKDSYQRWSAPRALKYKAKGFQKAEYKIRLSSNGTVLLPQIMNLQPLAGSSGAWVGTKNDVFWHSGDTIWSRFQDQDGFYTNWKKGVVANAGPDDTLCLGDVATLLASGGGSYLWNTGAGGPILQVFPIVSTKYWVTVSDGTGSLSTDTVKVSVHTMPSTPGFISGPVVVYPGQTDVVYSVMPVAGAQGYQWILPPGATITSGANSAVITVSFSMAAGSGVMRVSGTSQCGTGPLSPPLNIQVDGTIGKNIQISGINIQNGQSQCFDATSTIVVAGSDNPFVVESGGSVTLVAGQKIVMLPGTTVLSGGYLHAFITVDNSYCQFLSPVKSTEQAAKGMEQPGNTMAEATRPKVYPNPAGEWLNIEIPSIHLPSGYSADLYDIMGNRLRQVQFSGINPQRVSMAGLTPGVYILTISTGQNLFTFRIIKQ